MNFAKDQTRYDACMYNDEYEYEYDEYESFTMFALDLKRGMFCSHFKKKQISICYHLQCSRAAMIILI